MKIVVVDPSRVVLKIVAGALGQAGHEVSCFSDSSAALERLREDESIEVLVTSLQHSGMSGMELIRGARAIAGRRRALYVLVMSSSADRTTLIEALDGGADDFIGKPPAPEELLARLRVARRTATLQQELIRLATIDALTGLLNRRAFFETAELYSRSGTDAVAIFDIDRFKQVNDTYGHAAGDRVLVRLAQILRGQGLRQSDLPGRLGGEEFAVLLPGTTPANALAVAERLRLALEQSGIDSGEGHIIRVTLSAGLAPLAGDAEHSLALADAALYEAKNTGRNRVVLAGVPSPATA